MRPVVRRVWDMPDLGRLVRLGTIVWNNLKQRRSMLVLKYALPWGREGMAHSCRVVGEIR